MVDITTQIMDRINEAERGLEAIYQGADDFADKADVLGKQADAGRAITDRIKERLLKEQQINDEVIKRQSEFQQATVADDAAIAKEARERDKVLAARQAEIANRQSTVTTAAQKAFMESQGLGEDGKPLSFGRKLYNLFVSDPLGRASKYAQLSAAQQQQYNSIVSARATELSMAQTRAEQTSQLEAETKTRLIQATELLTQVSADRQLDQQAILALGEQLKLDASHIEALSKEFAANREIIQANLQIGGQLIATEQLKQVSASAKALEDQDQLRQHYIEKGERFNEVFPDGNIDTKFVAEAMLNFTAATQQQLKDALGPKYDSVLAFYAKGLTDSTKLLKAPLQERLEVESEDGVYAAQANELINQYLQENSHIDRHKLLLEAAGVADDAALAALDKDDIAAATKKMNAKLFGEIERAKTDFAATLVAEGKKFMLSEKALEDMNYSKEFAEQVSKYYDSSLREGTVSSRRELGNSIEHTMNNLALAFNRSEIDSEFVNAALKSMHDVLGSQMRNEINKSYDQVYQNTLISSLPLNVNMQFGVGGRDKEQFNLVQPTEWSRMFVRFAAKSAYLRTTGRLKQERNFQEFKPLTGAGN